MVYIALVVVIIEFSGRSKRSDVLFITARHILDHLHQQCLQSVPGRIMAAGLKKVLIFKYLTLPFQGDSRPISGHVGRYCQHSEYRDYTVTTLT